MADVVWPARAEGEAEGVKRRATRAPQRQNVAKADKTTGFLSIAHLVTAAALMTAF